MNRKHLILMLVGMLVLCFQSACTIEMSDNGDLDGYWHLEQVDTLATGGKLNLSKERVFGACSTS